MRCGALMSTSSSIGPQGSAAPPGPARYGGGGAAAESHVRVMCPANICSRREPGRSNGGNLLPDARQAGKHSKSRRRRPVSPTARFQATVTVRRRPCPHLSIAHSWPRAASSHQAWHRDHNHCRGRHQRSSEVAGRIPVSCVMATAAGQSPRQTGISRAHSCDECAPIGWGHACPTRLHSQAMPTAAPTNKRAGALALITQQGTCRQCGRSAACPKEILSRQIWSRQSSSLGRMSTDRAMVDDNEGSASGTEHKRN